jgi:hypothetical protein
VGALFFLLIFFSFVLFTIQAGQFGMLDAGIMGATIAVGGVMAHIAITGKEQRKIDVK